jgi:hypothetical protein
MDERDKELDAMLAPLRRVEPGELRLRRWALALRPEVGLFAPPPKGTRARWSAQIGAALALGFALGALTLHLVSPPMGDLVADTPSATIQWIYAKSE